MNSFKKSQANKILDCYKTTEQIMKSSSGEGSRGGKVIGHTKSGKAIYEGKDNITHSSNLRNMGIKDVQNYGRNVFIPHSELTKENVQKINNYLESRGLKPGITKFDDGVTLHFKSDNKHTVEDAKKWWSSLSINEQKEFEKKYFGKDFPRVSIVGNPDNILAMYESETK